MKRTENRDSDNWTTMFRRALFTIAKGKNDPNVYQQVNG